MGKQMSFKEFMDFAYPNRMASAHATYSEKDMERSYNAGFAEGKYPRFDEIGSLVEVVNELKRN